MAIRIERYGLDFRRLERFHHKFPWILAPANDIHLFLIQLAHDVLNTGTSHSDTSADRIHFLVRGPNCDFGAITSLSRDGLDLDSPVGDFTHLNLEQPSHKVRM